MSDDPERQADEEAKRAITYIAGTNPEPKIGVVSDDGRTITPKPLSECTYDEIHGDHHPQHPLAIGQSDSERFPPELKDLALRKLMEAAIELQMEKSEALAGRVPIEPMDHPISNHVSAGMLEKDPMSTMQPHDSTKTWPREGIGTDPPLWSGCFEGVSEETAQAIRATFLEGELGYLSMSDGTDKGPGETEYIDMRDGAISRNCDIPGKKAAAKWSKIKESPGDRTTERNNSERIHALEEQVNRLLNWIESVEDRLIHGGDQARLEQRISTLESVVRSDATNWPHNNKKIDIADPNPRFQLLATISVLKHRDRAKTEMINMLSQRITALEKARSQA